MSINPSGDANRLQQAVAQTVQEHWKLLLIEGIVLLVLGLLAILIPQIATLAVAILIGWLFLFSGVVGLVVTFMARGAPGFWWSLLSAILAIAAGLVLLIFPKDAVLPLTILLVVFFVIEGVASIMYALDHKRELSGRWGWMLASGIIDLVLAVMIYVGLPSTAEWAIGLLVGINLVFGGSAMIGIAWHARASATGSPTAV
jgi:uncharacterized membrane protein HdeD (DUF308 family)